VTGALLLAPTGGQSPTKLKLFIAISRLPESAAESQRALREEVGLV
jgi:hypothetical protein